MLTLPGKPARVSLCVLWGSFCRPTGLILPDKPARVCLVLILAGKAARVSLVSCGADSTR